MVREPGVKIKDKDTKNYMQKKFIGPKENPPIFVMDRQMALKPNAGRRPTNKKTYQIFYWLPRENWLKELRRPDKQGQIMVNMCAYLMKNL